MKGGTRTTVTRPDEGTRRYVSGVQDYAQSFMDPARSALGNLGEIGNLGLLGTRALSGDPEAASALMADDPVWGRLRERTLRSVNDEATRARAFGGSRHGIASGSALAGIADAQMQQLFQRALGLSTLGAEANRSTLAAGGPTALASVGSLLPHGTENIEPYSTNPFAGLLGTGLSVAGTFPGLFPKSWLGPGGAS